MSTRHALPAWNRKLLWLAVALLTIGGVGHLMALINGEEHGWKAVAQVSNSWMIAILVGSGLWSKRAKG